MVYVSFNLWCSFSVTVKINTANPFLSGGALNFTYLLTFAMSDCLIFRGNTFNLSHCQLVTSKSDKVAITTDVIHTNL